MARLVPDSLNNLSVVMKAAESKANLFVKVQKRCAVGSKVSDVG
jgi:hypothetical protein